MLELHRWVGNALAMVLLVGACGDDSEPKTAKSSERDSGQPEPSPGSTSRFLRYMGTVDGTDVRVGLLLARDRARIFFCGGPNSYEKYTRWFNVDYEGGEHLEFEFEEGGWHVHCHLMTTLLGEVVLGDGVERRISAFQLPKTGVAGLYEGKSDCGRVGLIITPATKEAEQMAQGACVSTTDGPIEQVTPISPIVPEAGKIPVHPPGEDDETLLLQAATLDPL